MMSLARPLCKRTAPVSQGSDREAQDAFHIASFNTAGGETLARLHGHCQRAVRMMQGPPLSAGSAASLLLFQLLLEVGDEVAAIGFILDPSKSHPVAGHKGRWVLQVFEQIVLRPNEPLGTGILVYFGVVEP